MSFGIFDTIVEEWELGLPGGFLVGALKRYPIQVSTIKMSACKLCRQFCMVRFRVAVFEGGNRIDYILCEAYSSGLRLQALNDD